MPKNRKIILVMLVTLELLAMYLMYKSSHNKKIVLDKVELKEENKNSSLAILYEKEKGKYEEYTENEFPKNYILNITNSKCIDEYGEELSNILKYINNQITIESNKTSYCTLYFDLPEIKEYNYTGNYQEFIASKDGYYKIELWGASGGDFSPYYGGKGAYVKGTIYLTKNDILYIYVGGAGSNTCNGGYNGGGDLHCDTIGDQSKCGSSGGGATDVRLNISDSGNWDNFDALKSRIMVAAGGGGANNRNVYNDEYYYGAGNGGYGGTLIGGNGESLEETHINPNTNLSWGWLYGTGGTQTLPGETVGECKNCEPDPVYLNRQPAMFGNGGYNFQSGGGSGYYGGGSSAHGGAGGGSSFISGYAGCVAIKKESTEENVQPKDGCTDGTQEITCSYHYSNKVFTETEMKAGNETMPTHDGDSNMIGNTGNGYAKITFVG